MLKFVMFALRMVLWGLVALAILNAIYHLVVGTYKQFSGYDVLVFVVVSAYLFYSAIVFTISPTRNNTSSGIRWCIYCGWGILLFFVLALTFGYDDPEYTLEESAPFVATCIILFVAAEILMYPVRQFARYYFERYPK